MLQRLQTLYLLIASICMLLASTLPLARFTLPNGYIVKFESTGVFLNETLIDSTWALLVMGAITSILAVVTIFLYKGRLLQIRLTILNTLIIIGFYIFAGIILFNIKNSSLLETAHFSIGIVAFLPLVAIVLSILAIRRIYADEALVRSLSRLR